MENNNLHSFDEQLKAAMEQFQPTPPADVWANVSSQIGNISTVSQVSLASKIAAIITKKIVLITTSAAVVASAIVYVVSNNSNEKEETVITPKEEIKQVVVADPKEKETVQPEKINITENNQTTKPETTPKEKKAVKPTVTVEAPKPAEKQMNDNPVVSNDKIIENIIKQHQNPVENTKPLPATTGEVKKCNSGAEIKESSVGNNYYNFEPQVTQPNYNYIWYLGDGYVEFNSPKISHQYNGQSEDAYMVSLVISKKGCKDSIVKRIVLTKELKFNVYNVFTPNGDGQNDDWNIQIDNVEMYELRVMDYKGDMVFETKNNNEKWNGQINNIGENCPRGSYTYMLIYKINKQEKINTLKGRVDLFR